MASEQQRVPLRQRRPSTSAPIVDIQGSVGPAGISRPKHKRTMTGLGPGEIKSVEGMCLSGWQLLAGSLVLVWGAAMLELFGAWLGNADNA